MYHLVTYIMNSKLLSDGYQTKQHHQLSQMSNLPLLNIKVVVKGVQNIEAEPGRS